MIFHRSLRNSKSPQVSRTILRFLLLVDYFKVWSSGRDLVIRLDIKILLEFMCLIFQERCWVVHIPFVCMVEFKFLAHLSVDHLAHPLMSNLILLLCKFAAFAYYVINHYVPIITKPTFAVLLCLILLLLLFTPLEFFPSVLADGFSLEFEWQQVSSYLQNSSHDSGRSYQCCRFDSLYPSTNFQVLQAF